MRNHYREHGRHANLCGFCCASFWAGVVQRLECLLAKQEVEGSNPFARSNLRSCFCRGLLRQALLQILFLSCPFVLSEKVLHAEIPHFLADRGKESPTLQLAQNTPAKRRRLFDPITEDFVPEPEESLETEQELPPISRGSSSSSSAKGIVLKKESLKSGLELRLMVTPPEPALEPASKLIPIPPRQKVHPPPEMGEIPASHSWTHKLTDSEGSRIDQAYIQMMQRVELENKKRWQSLFKDRRGEKELRLCSVDFNGYGNFTDVKKILRDKAPASVGKRGRELLEAIVQARCDLVAAQGLIGQGIGRLEAAVDVFAKKLSKRTKNDWRYLVGGAQSKNGFEGFLYRVQLITVMEMVTHDDKILPETAIAQIETFPRPPLQLSIRVRGKGKSEPRVLEIFNVNFSGNPEGDLQESGRMILAEGVRQIVDFLQGVAARTEKSIFIVVGQRVSGRRSPTARILEGTLRLSDFNEGGKCSLVPQHKNMSASCSDALNRPLNLSPLLENSFAERKTTWKEISQRWREIKEAQAEEASLALAAAAEDGENAPEEAAGDEAQESDAAQGLAPEAVDDPTKKAERGMCSDIYMFPKDLKIAWRKHYTPGRYMVGTEAADNGLKDCPLVWVDLNW